MLSPFAIFGFFFACLCSQSLAWSSGEKVKLTDVQVLTLYHGRQTTGRRSSPVSQLKCIGGTAGCSAFVPQVVQCSNKGSDGADVQWDCKADMDNAYRFGTIEVVCEGYEYPDDPYILKGSCGLEYTLDLTKEGVNQHSNTGGHNYYGNSYEQPQSSTLGNIVLLIIIGVIIYAVSVSCARANARGPAGTTGGYAPGDDWGSGGGTGGGFQGGPGRPNPPGFRPEYQPEGCGGGQAQQPAAGGGAGMGGFWGGAAMGGLLGYLFGGRNGGGYQRGYNRGWGGGGYGAPGGGAGFFGGGGGGGFGGSSGTRTASGFGGTRRR